MSFSREHRYLIFKLTDVERMDDDARQQLYGMAHDICAIRKDRGKGPLQCVVVEHDWPIYEQAWHLVATLCEGNAPPRQPSEHLAEHPDFAAYREATDYLITKYRSDAARLALQLAAPVNPHPPALSIVWYPSPEAAHRSMWEPVAIAEGMSYDELCQCQGGGITADGEEVEVSYEDEITGMKLAGAWGWVELDRHIIHAWADHQADPARVLHMLAHEIGHVTGQPHPDPLQEEMRAEQFGNAARLAYGLLQQRQEARHD